MTFKKSQFYKLNGRGDSFKFVLPQWQQNQWELVLMEYVVPGIGLAKSVWETEMNAEEMLEKWGAIELTDADLKEEVFAELRAVKNGEIMPRFSKFDWSVVGGKPAVEIDKWVPVHYWDESDEFQPRWGKIDTTLKEGSFLLVVAKHKNAGAKLLKKADSLQEIETFLNQQDWLLQFGFEVG